MRRARDFDRAFSSSCSVKPKHFSATPIVGYISSKVFKASIFAFAMLLLIPMPIHAQQIKSTPKSANTDTTSETTESAKAEKKAPTEQEKLGLELDPSLLGAWSVISKDASKDFTNESVSLAVAKCSRLLPITRLEFEPAAEKTLPDSKFLSGDTVYYRTKKGLQRLSLAASGVFLFPKINKSTGVGNRTFWTAEGGFQTVRLIFADAKTRGGTGQFMVEENILYLRCSNAYVAKETKTDSDIK